MPKVKCSLIISTYNWPQALHLCLQSVLKQQYLPDEVIIADDGSGQETRQLIESYRKDFPVPLIHAWHEDIGFRKTVILNMAVANSSFDYIIQIDGDIIIEKHFIADHLSSAEPKMFIRGTRAMINAKRTAQLLSAGTASLSIFSQGIKHRNNALRLFAFKALGTRKVMASNSVRGSNLSFWKADFILVNGYNNDLTGWGHEDEELASRFINAGIIKKIVKLCAVQYHLCHPVSNKVNEPMQRKQVEKIKNEKTIYCANGYQQVNI